MGLASLLLFGATEGLQNAAAEGETRSLTIHHTHTGENIEVVYKRNGRYDEGGLSKLNHFLRDWRNHEQTKMDPRLFDVVWEVYQEVGGNQPIQIISAYRSPATNAMLRRRSRGVAKFSQHMLGKAMDFNIPGVPLEKIRHAGLRLQRGGVGYYPSSGSPFVHLDVGNVRHWPRMPAEQLARVLATKPTRVAAASSSAGEGSGKRTFFGKLLGANANGGEDDEETVQTGRAARVKPRETAAQPETAAVRQAAFVPMPRVRPADPATSRPPTPRAEPAALTGRVTPAQIVQARGLWDGTEVLAAAEAPATTKTRVASERAGGERLVWQVGPQPVTTASSTLVPKRAPVPRSRPVAVASADAGLPWPVKKAEEQAPAEIALAYAAPAPAPQPNATASAPMGNLRPNTAAAPRPTAPRAGNRTASAGQLGDNPWLRGVMVAPSMQGSIAVTSLGVTNHRELVRLMHKPHLLIANTFADEPDFGLTSDMFSGAAVATVPTVTFGTMAFGVN